MRIKAGLSKLSSDEREVDPVVAMGAPAVVGIGSGLLTNAGINLLHDKEMSKIRNMVKDETGLAMGLDEAKKLAKTLKGKIIIHKRPISFGVGLGAAIGTGYGLARYAEGKSNKKQKN